MGAAAPTSSLTPTRDAASGYRVLIVDDEPELADFIAEIAEDLGFEAVSVNSALEFLEQFYIVKPDAVVMDIVMPDMDGIELIQWLAGEGSSVPVILTTGARPYFIDMVREIGTQKGANVRGALRKPFSATDLEVQLLQSISPPDAS